MFNITDRYEWCDKIDVADVWGIGRQWSKRLHQLNIHTVTELRNANPQWIKNIFNVVLQRTIYELSGQPCLQLEDIKPKQSIQASRSFGTMQTDYQPLAQELSRHCARAFEGLREQHLMTQHISVFIQSNRFRHDLTQYNPSIGVTLPNPTDDLRRITKASLSCLKKIYKQGIHYQKIGLMLTSLSNNAFQQLDLFNDKKDDSVDKTERLMQVLNKINVRFGRQNLRLASQGWQTSSSMKSDMKSPHYTTSWAELPKIKIKIQQ